MKKKESTLYENLTYESQINRLAQNENPYGPSPIATEAILKNIHKISLYPDVVLNELKEKLAENNMVSPKEVIVSNGSGTIIDSLIKRMMANGENMVAPEISFVAYKLCAAINDKECRLASMEDYSISLEKIAQCCDEKTRLIFLANPNNPTGTMFTHDEIAEFLLKISPEILVVLDEAYREYVDNPLYPDSIQLYREHPNVIILHSFSKIYGLAGLRIGYGIAQKPIIEELEKNRLPFIVGSISNIAALAALDDEEHIKESARKNAEDREFLFKGLTSLGYNVIPSQGNFLFISFPAISERDHLHDKLFSNKMVVRKMDAFGDNRSLRISLGRKEDNIRLLECLKK
ncbi:MAG: histidinol-phosphate transaminase [Bacteroidales bacterium]|nr:histidinol-phosphate transaminase [Bacteroidales bacterium]